MSMKRNPDDGKGGRSDDGSGPSGDDKRRRHAIAAAGSGSSSDCDIKLAEDIQNMIEPVIRRVVREEIELALRKHMSILKWCSGNELESSETRCLHLVFLNGVSLPVFTGAKIEGDDGFSLKAALVDVHSGEIFNSGPESSVKVEVVVLEGDFDSQDGDNWPVDEFRSNVVRAREGKKALLAGNTRFYLKEGVGLVDEVSFTDNSSWTRSRKFRLGIRVLDTFEGTRIKEAKTESFIVRDHRGELYKKHHPLSLNDEVWRLEKIGKDGAFHKRLSRENICTVKDFLTLLNLDAPRLRQMLGAGMTAKIWEVIVNHASTCIMDKRVYLYCPPESQQKAGVVFNIVRQIKGVISVGQYILVDKLTEKEKADAYGLLISSYEHLGEVISLDDETLLLGGLAHVNSLPYPSSSDSNNFFVTDKISGFDYAQSTIASPDTMSSIYSIGGVSSIGEFSPHGIGNMTPIIYDQDLNFSNVVCPLPLCDSESMAQAFLNDDQQGLVNTLQIQDPTLESHSSDLHSAVKSFLHPSSSTTTVCKAQRRWNMVCNVLKWFKLLTRKRIRDSEEMQLVSTLETQPLQSIQSKLHRNI